MKKLSLSVVVLLMCHALTFAQDKAKSLPGYKWEIGINAGVANFSGEYNMLNNGFKRPSSLSWSSDADFGFGAFVKRNFSHVFALEAAWNYSNLTGHVYDGNPIRNFKTEVNEYDLNSVWNINNLFSKNKFDRKIYWYAKLGIGATRLTAKTAATPLNGQNWKLPTIPLGTGVVYRLNDNLNLDLGTQWSWVNTDRLDGHYTLSNAGNTKPGNTLADIFGTKVYTHVGLSYTFGKRKKKPEPVVVVEAPKPQPKPEPKPEPKKAPEEVKVVVKPAVIGNVYKVYFAFDKWNLNNQSISDLDKLAKDMNENPSVNVEIKSHTDCRGPASYNMKLSEKRGKSVIDYLVSKGVNISKINAQAFGETQPVNKCKDGVPCTKAEYALNRRTETIVIE